MPTFHFSFVLELPTTLTEDLGDRLYAAGCDDATPSSFGGAVVIDFARDSSDLESAIGSAVHDVQKSGCAVARAELNNASLNSLGRHAVSHRNNLENSRNKKIAIASGRSRQVDVGEEVFQRIDAVVEKIRKHAIEPEFSQDVKRREAIPTFDCSDERILEEMITLIAFSQQVPAVRIADMVKRGVLKQVFGSFSPPIVARMNPEDLRQKYWTTEWLSPIRFPSKLEKMVSCAQGLLKIRSSHGTYMRFLRTCSFPLSLCSSDDINSFWTAFDRARSNSPAFYRNFTSLCHLLQSLGFPCAKPDRIVMNVGEELRIVQMRKQHSELDRQRVIRLMQEYAERTKLRVPVVDLMFLIHGGQTEARRFVSASYYTSTI
jgi:3-methyladenine DNA glycosylase Tag